MIYRALLLVPLVACLGGVPTPIIRAKMSKLVDADEQGEFIGISYILSPAYTHPWYPRSLSPGLAIKVKDPGNYSPGQST